MAFSNVLPGSDRYPEVRLRWAPTSQPTDSSTSFSADITDRLRAFEWGYGRNDELGRFEAGNGHVILDNRDRAFDPSFDAGAWFGNIKPRREFELVARWDSVEYPLFSAYARGFPQAWPSAGHDALVRVELVDAFAVLQGIDMVVGFSRPAETVADRLQALLVGGSSPIGLRAGQVAIDGGGGFGLFPDVATPMVEALEEVTQPGTSALDHAKQVAESGGGQLFVNRNGVVVYHHYERRLGAASLHTFSDSATGTLPYTADLAPAFDETYLWNYARASGSGDATAHVAEDTGSQDDYFKLVKTLSTLLVSGSDIQQVADRTVLRYAQPELRAPALTLQGARDPDALWPVILGVEVSDRVTVERFADAADPMVLVQNVEGIRHSCRPGGPWVTTLATSPADTNLYLELDDATLGELDDIYALA